MISEKLQGTLTEEEWKGVLPYMFSEEDLDSLLPLLDSKGSRKNEISFQSLLTTIINYKLD